MTEHEIALPDDRLAWKEKDILIDGKLWEVIAVTVTPEGREIVRAHIGQNRWRTASRIHDSEWGWDHSR